MTARWLDRCHFGDVRDVLRRMIADGVRVNTIVTSPPYWGLRSYLPDGHPDKAREIGSEPTLREFIATLVDVFELCRQMLSDDGTAWINMGDSYASRGGQTPMCGELFAGRARAAANICMSNRSAGIDGLKSKDLMGQPWRLAFALQDAGWYLRQDIIWEKPNPMPESVRDRCTKAHEYVFLLSKSRRYYFDQDAIREPASQATHERRAMVKMPDGWDTGPGAHGSFHRDGREARKYGLLTGRISDGAHRTKAGLNVKKLASANSGIKNNGSFDAAMDVMPAMRNKRSVWTVASEPFSGAHFATFPTKLIEPCILAGCPAGGVVLDPFFGSGTTGQVAQALGRHFIGVELNREYEALQAERLRQLSLEFSGPQENDILSTEVMYGAA